MLVSGRSSLGSPFRADDFVVGKDVADTDGDGMMEFIDAWGEPLQFYRWPIHFRSDLQKGPDVYNTTFEVRQQNSLDTGSQLIAPAWFADYINGTANPSGNATLFQQLFTSWSTRTTATPALDSAGIAAAITQGARSSRDS